MKAIYSNAFTETLFIIRCLPYNDQNRIPKDFMEFLINNKNDDYEVKIDPSISLQNQCLLEETKEILKEIFISFFISAEDKNKILQNDKYMEIMEENLKSKNNNYNNMFENKKIESNIDNKIEAKNVIVERKESIIRKIISKIENFLFRR